MIASPASAHLTRQGWRGPEPVGDFAWFSVETCPSTQDALRAAIAGWRAEPDGPPAVALMADRQTKGRGRRDRRWVDAEGGLALSMFFPDSMLVGPGRPEGGAGDLRLDASRKLAIGLPLAVIAAVERCVGPAPGRLGVGWPNDLLIGRAKCGGMLLDVVSGSVPAPALSGAPFEAMGETRGETRGEGGGVLVGVGVNLAAPPEGGVSPSRSGGLAGAPGSALPGDDGAGEAPSSYEWVSCDDEGGRPDAERSAGGSPRAVCCLAELGLEPGLTPGAVDLARAVLEEATALCGELRAGLGWPVLQARWGKRAVERGRRVRAMVGGEVRVGRCLGIGSDGALALAVEDEAGGERVVALYAVDWLASAD